MSLPETDADLDVVEPEICDFCGCYITEVDPQCPALDDGRCRPNAHPDDELRLRDLDGHESRHGIYRILDAEGGQSHD